MTLKELHINNNEILFLETYNYDPYFNMAADEYFLELCNNNKINGILRFYTWNKLSISIGYFFKKKHLNLKEIQKNDVALVRRITGGNLLFHGNDFTYSLVLKKGLYNIYNKKDFYYYIGKILQEALQKLNISCCINESLSNTATPFCFDSISQYEISTKNGKKLIGSAQKILNNSFLQHGSFFFKKIDNFSHLINFNYNNLNNYILKSLTHQNISKIFKKIFSQKLKLSLYNLSVNDKIKIQELINSKYLTDIWNLRK